MESDASPLPLFAAAPVGRRQARLIAMVRREERMIRYRFPGSVPRKMYWSDAVAGCSVCPDCGTPLESEHHTYLMATRRAGNFDAHLVGNTAGHFCSNCPVVVLGRGEFERFAFSAAGDVSGVDYAVMGIVDLDSVPPDKQNIPFDDDTNPVPLVEFSNLGRRKPSASSRRGRRPDKKRKGKRKGR